MSEDQVTAFIEAQKDFAPDIVVLDTLATALAGEDENSSKAAAFSRQMVPPDGYGTRSARS